jgi:cysteinyl-tRNA synthetase
MAQNRSCCGDALAHTWVHNGMINIDNREMHKSTGNVLLAKDLIARYGGPACRYAMISTHYRAPLNISAAVLEGAAKEVEKMKKTLSQAALQLSLKGALDENAPKDAHWDAFMAELDHDLNTPNAISELQSVIKEINIENRKREIDTDRLNSLLADASAMLYVLGVDARAGIPDQHVLDLYREWKAAAKEKNFEKADVCRKELMETGWI